MNHKYHHNFCSVPPSPPAQRIVPPIFGLLCCWCLFNILFTRLRIPLENKSRFSVLALACLPCCMLICPPFKVRVYPHNSGNETYKGNYYWRYRSILVYCVPMATNEMCVKDTAAQKRIPHQTQIPAWKFVIICAFIIIKGPGICTICCCIDISLILS